MHCPVKSGAVGNTASQAIHQRQRPPVERRSGPCAVEGRPYEIDTARTSTSSRTPGRALPPESARYHAQILRTAADLLLAGEPVYWTQPEYQGGKRRITYLFDADALRTATVAMWNRVKAGDEDYVIRVKLEEPMKPRYRKRR